MTNPSTPNLYFIIVDRRDEFLYRSLLLASNNNEHVWGLRQRDEPLWKQLNTGDIICVMLEDDHQFTVQGRIHQLKFDPDTPKQWSTNFRATTMQYLIYFSNMHSIQVPRGKIINYAIDLDTKHMPGLHKVQTDKSPTILDKIMPSSTIPVPCPFPVDINGPPDKIKHITTRFIRDTKKSQELKTLYENRCQICNYRLEIDPSNHYSEAHHIWPLHAGGDDDFDNIVVLCPTHHAEFDYGIICIDSSGTHIVDKDSKKIGILRTKKNHSISPKNILHNLDRLGLR